MPAVTDIVQAARAYLQENAAETGADALIEQLADEVERLRETLVEANNCWRHDFAREIDDATDKLFRKLSARQTQPFYPNS